MSEQQVHAQAAERALADAGVEFADLDGYATTGFFPMFAVGMCEYFGIRPHYVDETNWGGASFEVLVEHAASAVETGVCDTGLVTYRSVLLSAIGRKLRTRGGTGAPAGPAPLHQPYGD